MIEIDGSHGEGGGQIIRIAAALALITQQQVRVKNIRAKRERSGLRPQHLSALRLLTELSETRIEGLKVGATEVEIYPGKLNGGKKRIDIGTAGSIALLLQCILLPFAVLGEKLELTIIGGTDVTRAPTMDYVKEITLPTLAKLGLKAEVEVEQRGFYPQGGGVVRAVVEPSELKGWICRDAEGEPDLYGKIVCSGLPEHVSTRMEHAARKVFLGSSMHFENEFVKAKSPGVSITLWAKYRNCVLGSSNVGEKGVPAERIGEECADELRRSLAGRCTVDAKMADQILPFLVFASGSSEFTTKYLSQHTLTVAWVLQQFVSRKIEFSGEKERACVRVS